MKKILLTVIFIASCVAMNAQDLQGKWFVGGQFGYTNGKAESKFGDVKTSIKMDTYTILPTVGTFITSDIAVGAAVGYSGGKIENLKSNQIVVQPLVRKYWNISGGLFFFGQASLPISFGDINYDLDDIDLENPFGDKIKTFGVNFQLAPGFDYIINDKFSIETSFNILTLGYNSQKQGDDKLNTFGFFANPEQKFGDLKIGFKMIF